MEAAWTPETFVSYMASQLRRPRLETFYSLRAETEPKCLKQFFACQASLSVTSTCH